MARIFSNLCVNYSTTRLFGYSISFANTSHSVEIITRCLFGIRVVRCTPFLGPFGSLPMWISACQNLPGKWCSNGSKEMHDSLLEKALCYIVNTMQWRGDKLTSFHASTQEAIFMVTQPLLIGHLDDINLYLWISLLFPFIGKLSHIYKHQSSDLLCVVRVVVKSK